MPTIPSASDFRPPSLRPSTNVASYRAGQLAEAQIQTGQDLTQAGAELSRMAAEEQAKIDRTVVDARITQQMQAEIEFTKEYQAVKGGDVINPDNNFHKTFQEKYTAKIAELSQGLTESQKVEFQKVAKRRAVQFDADRYTYAVREAERFEDVAYADRIQVLADTGSAVYGDAAKLSDTIVGAEVAVAKYLTSKGLIKKGEKLSDTKEMKRVYGLVYGQALDQALVNQDTAGANALYARASPLLSQDQRDHFSSRLKPANEYADAQVVFTKAMDMVKAGKSEEDIIVELAKAPSEQARQIATNMFAAARSAHDRALADQAGDQYVAFDQAGGGREAMLKVMASPEFAKLPGAERGRLTNYMQQNAEQEDQRIQQERRQAIQDQRSAISFSHEQQRWADYKSDKQKEAKSFEQLGKMLAVMESPDFPKMSRNELWAKAPEIGKENVVKLLTEQSNLLAGTKKAQIDPDILSAAVPKKLWEKGEKDKLMAFKGFIQAGLDDWKQANPGKVPTPDDQRRIANSANAKWVEVKDWWPDKEHTAYEGPPDAWVKQLQDSAKKKGKVLTPEQVNKAWRLQSIQGQ